MKARLEPEKLKNILEAGMITNLMSPLVITTSKDGISMMNMYGGSIATNHLFEQNFFIKYSNGEKSEEIAIPGLISKKLGFGFSDDEMDFITDEESFYLVGKRVSYDNELDEIPGERYYPDYIKKLTPIKEEGKKNILGYLPISKDKFDPDIIVMLDASELKVPSARNYELEMKDKKLELRSSDEGNLKVTFKIDKRIKTKNGSCTITGDFFKSVATCLDGNVLLAIDINEGHTLNLALSEKGKGYRKVFCIAGMVEGEEEPETDDDKDKKE